MERLHTTFAAPQLHQPTAVEEAMGVAVRSIVTTLLGTDVTLAEVEAALAARFDNHPDAEILRSLPGLGVILGGRVLGHEAALRRLGSKLVGQLHHCLQHREPYREDIAWPTTAQNAPPTAA